MVFPFEKKRVFHVNICVFVYDCYLELIILVAILFGTQHLSSSNVWDRKSALDQQDLRYWIRLPLISISECVSANLPPCCLRHVRIVTLFSYAFFYLHPPPQKKKVWDGRCTV